MLFLPVKLGMCNVYYKGHLTAYVMGNRAVGKLLKTLQQMNNLSKR